MLTIRSWIMALGALALTGQTSAFAQSSFTWQCQFEGWEAPLTFIDLKNGKGKVVANIGSADVWVVSGSAAVTFPEPLGMGAVQVATIDVATGEAAYSRKTIIAPEGKPIGGKTSFMPNQVLWTRKPWE